MDEFEEPEVTLPSVSIPGEAPGLPAGLDPVEDWSEVDEDYEPIPETEDDDEDEVDEDLTDEEIEPPEEVADIVLYWATYELHGRNLDAGTPWQLLASEPYDGTFEVEVEGLTAGASWEFRIRLIDHNGRASRFSDELQIHLPTDFTPPPAPLPPFVDENLGFVTLSTTGELTGETPEDMSHLVLYVQQMHPQGDPEGEPGDPQRMTTFPGAGSWSISTLLAHVRYRAFLTAVDTTGNESPWSEHIGFIPSVAFDVSELEDQLEHLNEERLPALEQSISDAAEKAASDLQDFRDQWEEEWDPEAIDDLRARQHGLEGDLASGLQEAFNEAEALAEAARGNAVAQAAAAAQTEYERLQELAERALSRAGDNIIEDPSFETSHWPSEWNGQGGRLVRTATSSVRTGSQTLVIEDGSDTDFTFPDVDVELDQSYRMTIWHRTWGGGSTPDLSNEQSALVILDSDTGAELAVSEPLTTGVTFRRAEVVYTVAAGVTSIRPAIRAAWPTGQVGFDDVSFREVGAAAEALRQAELARQEAEAAHLEAGSARDLAADAYASASGKSTVHWSLSAPSGTGVHGDVWWRYEVARGRRVVIGEWHWDNGWQPADIAVQRVPSIDIGSGTFGDLAGSRIQINSVDADRVVINNTLKARHVDMVDFTSNQGFIDRAFVTLIQGKMANFDQALIGGVLLKEGSIGAKHLIVSDSDNMVKDPRFDSISNSSSAGGWSISGATPAQVRVRDTATGQRVVELRSSFTPTGTVNLTYGSNREWPVRAGEKFHYEFMYYRNAAAAGTGEVRAWATIHDRNGAYVGWAGGHNRLDNIWNTGYNTLSGVLTIPNAGEQLYLRWQFRVVNIVGQVLFSDTIIRRGLGGKMVVEGLLQANTAELQELFFDTAVGNAISLGIANVIEINADRIRSNSWTGQVMTGPTMQSHAENNRGWRLQPGNGLQIWTNTGAETVRLNGTDNLLMGRIHAGMTGAGGITLDYGAVGVHSGWNDDAEEWEDIRLTVTPHIEFHTHHNHTITPKLWVSDEGYLTITPGRVLNDGRQRGVVRLYGEMWSNTLRSRRLDVPTTSALQPGGLLRDGPRTRLHGRTPAQSGPLDMFTTGQLGSYTPGSGNTAYRGTVSWANPPISGNRRPVASGGQTDNSWNQWRYAVATVSTSAGGSFGWTLVGSDSAMSMWLFYNAWWE